MLWNGVGTVIEYVHPIDRRPVTQDPLVHHQESGSGPSKRCKKKKRFETDRRASLIFATAEEKPSNTAERRVIYLRSCERCLLDLACGTFANSKMP